jgi:phage terminase large subunit
VRSGAPSPSRSTRTRSAWADIARDCRRIASARAVDFGTYFGRPVDFQRDVFGYEPIEAQIAVFDALERTGRVAAPSGRAMGKSRLDAGEALYFAATRPGSLVVLLAPTFKQIQKILWEELRSLYYAAKMPLGGYCATLANTGARLGNGSRIFGITGSKPEDIAGIRSPRMLVICDEASGIEDPIFTTLDGNLAGGGWMLLTGNPTRGTGYFREACRSPRFRRVHLPSTASPNVISGEVLVAGIATREWVEERKQEWGEDSPLYKIHVLGQFVELAEGRLFSEAMVKAAEEAWSETPAAGRLVVAIDPAGESGDGDESAFACRMGKKVVEIVARRGLTPDAHVVDVLGLIGKYVRGRRTPANRPLVVVDRDGYVGAKVYAALGAYQSRHEHAFELRGVRGGERAKRRPFEFDRVRDEVWLSLVDAFRDGLAIPEDLKLERELAAIKLERHVSGRTKVTSKDNLRRELGRSPDRADALALSAFVSDVVVSHDMAPSKATAPDPYEADPETTIDPYAALEKWQ